ncbi:MAG: hypothetical protein K2Q18_16260 [Bdellovibrionales bacterium]|nr:hypothetical protein [Bdellovibrionales bacterium]
MTFTEAVAFLKRFVKYSEVKNQKHIDLSLCLAEDRFRGQEALMVSRMAVEKGDVTENQLKIDLGLE